MDQDDIEYFAARADRELQQARRATNPAVVRAHFILASYYRDKLRQRPADRLASTSAAGDYSSPNFASTS